MPEGGRRGSRCRCGRRGAEASRVYILQRFIIYDITAVKTCRGEGGEGLDAEVVKEEQQRAGDDEVPQAEEAEEHLHAHLRLVSDERYGNSRCELHTLVESLRPKNISMHTCAAAARHVRRKRAHLRRRGASLAAQARASVGRRRRSLGSLVPNRRWVPRARDEGGRLRAHQRQLAGDKGRGRARVDRNRAPRILIDMLIN